MNFITGAAGLLAVIMIIVLEARSQLMVPYKSVMVLAKEYLQKPPIYNIYSNT